MPRVRKGKDIKFNDGPQAFSRHYVEPKDGITQTFHMHLEEYGPGGNSQKHGHVNEAAFYILDGTGYEIHDGIRYDWKAGDIAVVHNNCVHQHFNASSERRVVDTENRLLNTNHAVVGYFTAKSWNLPLHLCEAIASHHNVLAIFRDESGDAQLKTLLAILKMAEHICESHRVLGNQTEDHEWDSIEQLVLEYVGLSGYDFENLRESIRDMGAS